MYFVTLLLNPLHYQVMLETEQEDNKEKEREKALAIQRLREEKAERREQELLFGKPGNNYT